MPRFLLGRPLSLLDGVPVLVKEEFDVIPYTTYVGTSFINHNNRATRDATIVRKLREAGAIILGIANMHEIGIGVTGNNPNSRHGTPVNPWSDIENGVILYPGGSSSGSAAGVSLGMRISIFDSTLI